MRSGAHCSVQRTSAQHCEVVTPAGARYFLYAVAVARIGRLLTGTARRLLDAVTGVVLVALGVRLAADAR